MRTAGQVYYEHKCPKYVQVYNRFGEPIGSIATFVPPWHLLTQEARDSMEQSAIGHYSTQHLKDVT
jgi:hypothetical protein